MVGLIGSMLQPHNLYLHSSLVRDKRIDRESTYKMKEAMFYFNCECAFSLFISLIINGAVLITFAHWYGGDDTMGLMQAADLL